MLQFWQALRDQVNLMLAGVRQKELQQGLESWALFGEECEKWGASHPKKNVAEHGVCSNFTNSLKKEGLNISNNRIGFP
jgi:hypothetical protein